MEHDDELDALNLAALLQRSLAVRDEAKTARRSLGAVVGRCRAARAEAERLRAEAAALRERQMAGGTPSQTSGSGDAPKTVTLLYASRLAPGVAMSTVVSIARVARIRNLQDGITGLLAFDGSSFVQLLEGPANAIVDLEQRLRRDRRHLDFATLSFGLSKAGRRFPQWQLGILNVGPGDVAVDRLRRVQGDQALVLFEAMLPALDRGVASALPG